MESVRSSASRAPRGPEPDEAKKSELEDKLHLIEDEEFSPSTFFLLVVRGEHEGRLFALQAEDTLIGRGRTADVRFDDPSVSQSHARVVRGGGRHFIMDLGSTNGTYVNGERITELTELSNGDAVQVADVVLAYLSTSDDDRTMKLRAPGSRMLSPVSPVGAIESANIAYPVLSRPDEEDSFDKQIDKLISMLAFVRRHWKLLLGAAVAAALTGYLTIFTSPPLSEAEFAIQLRPTPSDNPVGGEERPSFQFFTSAEQSFTSPEVVRTTLVALGDPNPTAPRVQHVVSQLRLESTGLQTYRGTYRDADPDAAVAFLSRHVDVFLKNEIDKTLAGLQTKLKFLRDRVDETERLLLGKEAELRRFKEENVSALPEFAAEALGGRSTLSSRRAELLAESTRLRAELSHARRRLNASSPILEEKQAAARQYDSAIFEANQRLEAARAKGLGPEHPEVKALTQQLAALKSMREQTAKATVTELERASSVAYRELATRVGDLEGASRGSQKELAEVNSQLAKMDESIRRYPEIEAEYAKLNRGYQSAQEIYRKLYEQLKKSEIQIELERASAQARYDVLTAPRSSGVPLRKTIVMRSGIGAFSGLMVALVLAAVIELRRYLANRERQRMAVGPLGADIAQQFLTKPSPNRPFPSR